MSAAGNVNGDGYADATVTEQTTPFLVADFEDLDLGVDSTFWLDQDGDGRRVMTLRPFGRATAAPWAVPLPAAGRREWGLGIPPQSARLTGPRVAAFLLPIVKKESTIDKTQQVCYIGCMLEHMFSRTPMLIPIATSSRGLAQSRGLEEEGFDN